VEKMTEPVKESTDSNPKPAKKKSKKSKKNTE
jgi:hypothetical protein